MAYLSQFQYYTNGTNPAEETNWGSYQYTSLSDIVNNFMAIYAGNNELVNNVERYQVLFHAKRAIQELNYDAFKEIKALELSVDNELRFVLPSDYVNWVRISLYRDGVIFPLTENIQLNSSSAYLQDNESRVLFDQDGNILKPEYSNIDIERIKGTKKSIYLNENNPNFNGREGWCCDGSWYFEYNVGARYGLNTETANANPTFRIDKSAGVINFSSGMLDKIAILEYVSDGMEGGDIASISVNKLFEDYVYAHIKYAILSSKLGVQEYIVGRSRKEKTALLRNAKIRISNIHPGRLLMNLRGQNKWLK
ncbi:MAG TPA: hypothetical protein DCY51_09560 [Bacteroidetes bacterium]|nr:hypothetical protein [Bacteroidota bacterium]|tara:strand:+ start:856 stop:1782 length:927 start_codon:yes stop_codon:yes gene_type:complete